MSPVQHLRGQTFHSRKGSVDNRFRYGVDFVLLDAEKPDLQGPALFGRNKGRLFSLWDKDHGGPPRQGQGAVWVRQVLRDQGLQQPARIDLLAQPRVLGHGFNPVSFWLCLDAEGALRVVIAEVTNTYGDRHSYLCLRDDRAPITAEDQLTAQKILHVSPFQPVEGGYRFRFDLRPDRLHILIDYNAGENGVVATLTGPLAPLTNRTILGACLRRPFGSRRVLALIHWQALRLWWKGARFRNRPEPPPHEVSR